MSFDSNGGKENFEAQDVNYGDLVTYPGNPTKDGYTFVGWYYEPTGTEWDFKEIGMPAEDLTHTARWAPREYTATFDLNYQGAPQADTATIYHDGYVAFPLDPKRDGYGFAGWFKDAAATEPYDRNAKVTGDITLFAKWVAGMNQVTFNSDGGTNVPGVAVGTDGLVPRPNPDPVKPGHDFQGWFRQDGTAWDFAKDKMPAEDITLVAHWRLHAFDVTFDLAGGESEVPATQRVEYQQLVTRPADPTRDGYDFAGWVDQNGNAYDFTVPVEGNIALTAQWKAQDRTITFESNGGSQVQSQTVKYDAAAQQPVDPTREGYDFGGWFTDAGFAAGSEFDFKTKVKADTTLYAKWAIKKFTVKYEANFNGDSSVANMPEVLQGVEWNTAVIDPTPTDAQKPTRTGYTFTGWFADAEAKTPFDFAATPITADTVIYAGWTLNRYTVRFDASAGEDAVTGMPSDLSVSHGDVLTLPAQTPQREGYEFAGWYTTGDFVEGSRYDFSAKVTGDVTLYAKWTQVETPVPGPEEKPNPDPGDNPETKPEEKPEEKPEVGPDDNKPETEPEEKPEEKPEIGPDDNKPETEPEVKPDPGEQPEDKPEVDPEPGDQPEVGPETKPETNPDVMPEEEPEATPEQGPESKPEVNPEFKPEVKPEANGRPSSDDKQSTDPNDVQKAVQPATLPKTDDANNAVIPAAIATIGSAFLGLAAMLRRRKSDI